MSVSERSIDQVTQDIWGCMLILPLEDRRAIGALLRWKPDLSEWLSSALRHVDTEWTRQGIIDDYLVFLHNLEHRVQRVPINWSDIANSNMELEAIHGIVSQRIELFPTLPIRRHIQDGTEGSNRALDMLTLIISGIFNDVDQVVILGGNFKIISPHAVERATTSASEGPIPPGSPDGIEDVLEDA
ncbi:hypothetical protein CPC08DRAFT_824351 [Agrocybe pediades]|nr:hypothetical protein CPC08DRAFT_824351 [Agrocybe pediades]